jgi:hypothetical protein
MQQWSVVCVQNLLYTLFYVSMAVSKDWFHESHCKVTLNNFDFTIVAHFLTTTLRQSVLFSVHLAGPGLSNVIHLLAEQAMM